MGGVVGVPWGGEAGVPWGSDAPVSRHGRVSSVTQPQRSYSSHAAGLSSRTFRRGCRVQGQCVDTESDIQSDYTVRCNSVGLVSPEYSLTHLCP